MTGLVLSFHLVYLSILPFLIPCKQYEVVGCYQEDQEIGGCPMNNVARAMLWDTSFCVILSASKLPVNRRLDITN